MSSAEPADHDRLAEHIAGKDSTRPYPARPHPTFPRKEADNTHVPAQLFRAWSLGCPLPFHAYPKVFL
eukprot:899051-Pyramimonas_sp.AAC.1